jgi:hypothetical protein
MTEVWQEIVERRWSKGGVAVAFAPLLAPWLPSGCLVDSEGIRPILDLPDGQAASPPGRFPKLTFKMTRGSFLDVWALMRPAILLASLLSTSPG